MHQIFDPMDESMDVAGLAILIVFVHYQYLESFKRICLSASRYRLTQVALKFSN